MRVGKIKQRILRIGSNIRAWGSGHCTAHTLAVLIGVCIGLISGVMAWVLKMLIAGTSHILSSIPSTGAGMPILLILPLAGILLSVAYQQFVLRRNIEHGTERVKQQLDAGKTRLGRTLIYAPIIASTLTLGFGGSAGSEGPIATSSAAVGSAVGRIFGLPKSQMRLMIGIGAGAGIAGIFKAPLGGALFTIEVLMLEMTTLSMIALIISCIASSMTAYTLSAWTYDINVTSPVAFEPSILPYVIIFGVLCGAYSLYYSAVSEKLRRFFEKRKNIWTRAIISGAILSVLIFIFPMLYGEGYASLTKLLNGSRSIMSEGSIFRIADSDIALQIVLIAGMLLAKPAAACSSNSGGGVAGDFAPTLFAGGIFGFLFATTINAAFGLELTTAGFAYIGMAGVMAGAIRAPLMAIFLAAEMCDGYQLFLPLLIAATISFCIVKAVGNRRAHRHA